MIINTAPIFQLYTIFTIWLKFPDPYEGGKRDEYVDVYMLCHDTSNENTLLAQLEGILSD